jgi:hypothetical protein
MTKPDNHTNTNFWFGFALGSITLTAAAYMLGTKKGREKLKQLIEYADTMENMPEELFALLPTIKDMLRNGGNKPEVEEPAHQPESIPEQIESSLESIIEKVKNTAEEKKDTKKYFIKSDS